MVMILTLKTWTEEQKWKVKEGGEVVFFWDKEWDNWFGLVVLCAILS